MAEWDSLQKENTNESLHPMTWQLCLPPYPLPGMWPILIKGLQLSSLMPERSETQYCSGRVFSPSFNTCRKQETHWPVGVHVLLREKHHMEALLSSWPHVQRTHFLCVFLGILATCFSCTFGSSFRHLWAHWGFQSCVFFEGDSVSKFTPASMFSSFTLPCKSGQECDSGGINTMQQSDSVWFLRLSHERWCSFHVMS